MRLRDTNPRNLLVNPNLIQEKKKKSQKKQTKKVFHLSCFPGALFQRLPLLDAGREQKLLYPTLTNRAFWHQEPSPGLAAVDFSLGKDVTCQFLPVK